MKSRRAPRLAALGLAAGMALSACGASGKERPSASATNGVPSTEATAPHTTPPGAPTFTPGIVHVTPSTGGRPGESPAPVAFPWESKVAVDATVRPSCVVRGGTATIVVRTVPNAAVIYHAVYAGTKGGAPPPYGHGYGGSDGGMSDGDGRYSDSWDVRVDAPVGPARVDVVVGDGENFGYDGPTFFVVSAASRCP